MRCSSGAAPISPTIGAPACVAPISLRAPAVASTASAPRGEKRSAPSVPMKSRMRRGTIASGPTL
jgi:hypothetical protein